MSVLERLSQPVKTTVFLVESTAGQLAPWWEEEFTLWSVPRPVGETGRAIEVVKVSINTPAESLVEGSTKKSTELSSGQYAVLADRIIFRAPAGTAVDSVSVTTAPQTWKERSWWWAGKAVLAQPVPNGKQLAVTGVFVDENTTSLRWASPNDLSKLLLGQYTRKDSKFYLFLDRKPQTIRVQTEPEELTDLENSWSNSILQIDLPSPTDGVTIAVTNVSLDQGNLRRAEVSETQALQIGEYLVLGQQIFAKTASQPTTVKVSLQSTSQVDSWEWSEEGPSYATIARPTGEADEVLEVTGVLANGASLSPAAKKISELLVDEYTVFPETIVALLENKPNAIHADTEAAVWRALTKTAEAVYATAYPVNHYGMQEGVAGVLLDGAPLGADRCFLDHDKVRIAISRGALIDRTISLLRRFTWAYGAQKLLNEVFWDPRVLSLPALSLRVAPRFDGVPQIGGGSLSLSNGDGYFHELDLDWEAGATTVKLGVDLPGEEQAYEDYLLLNTWRNGAWERTEESFTLQLLDLNSSLRKLVNPAVYTADNCLDPKAIGTPIPVAYGVIKGAVPVLVDEEKEGRWFQLASHPITAIDEIRLKTETKTVKPENLKYDLERARFRISNPGEFEISVDFQGKPICDFYGSVKNALPVLSEVVNDGYWFQVALHPIESIDQVLGWDPQELAYVPIIPAEVDLPNAAFRLTGWDGEELRVDFRGRPGPVAPPTLMRNAADIISDILHTIAEPHIDTLSISEARKKLMAYRELPAATSRHRFEPWLYLTKATEALEAISNVTEAMNAYLFPDVYGKFALTLFEPAPGDQLGLHLTEEDIFELAVSQEPAQLSALQVVYAHHVEQEWRATVFLERPALQHRSGEQGVKFEEREAFLRDPRDAAYFAQRTLRQDGVPNRIFQISASRRALLLRPGDQFELSYAPQGLRTILEVLEISADFASDRVAMVAGDRHGWRDAAGLWTGTGTENVISEQKLPERFAGLQGYGNRGGSIPDGSLLWNKDWAPEIKAWARQNAGYWTDPNGFADKDDPESHIPSSWF